MQHADLLDGSIRIARALAHAQHHLNEVLLRHA